MKLLVLAIVIFFARNFFIPISADDYVYRFIWNSDAFHGISNDWIPISSFKDIFDSQIEHYLHWGGRSVVHSIIQFFMWQGEIYFDFANTIVFAIFVILILKIARSKNVWWTLIALWICLPQFVPTMLWLTGSVNYLWMTTLQLGFLLALFEESFLAIPLGFLAGWSNEAGAISIFVLSLIHLRTKKDPILPREIVAMISLSIGLILLFAAPGNFERGEAIASHIHENLAPFVKIIVSSLPLIATTTLRLNQRATIFLLGGFIAPISLLFSPEFPTRAAFISPILFLIASLITLEQIEFHDSLKKIFGGILSILLATTVAVSLYTDFQIHRQFESRQISEEVKSLQGFPHIEKFLGERIVTQEILDNDPKIDENHEYNRAMAKFYGVEKIRRIE